MSTPRKCSLMTLRIAAGWLLFYAGITKVIDPDWSAVGYLLNAQTFSGFYEWLASPALLPIVDQANQWGLIILGVMIMLGFLTRTASWVALVLMLLYYFPVLNFPYAGDHSFIIDEHIIYALVFWLLAAFHAGNRWGIDGYMLNKKK